jgi:hypothetical protein
MEFQRKTWVLITGKRKNDVEVTTTKCLHSPESSWRNTSTVHTIEDLPT